MPSRVSLPGANELFRPTGAPVPREGEVSGRVRHDEKITVYVSADELVGLEEARLTLRRAGVAVDRGRLVRAAIAVALADVNDHGVEAHIVARLGVS